MYWLFSEFCLSCFLGYSVFVCRLAWLSYFCPAEVLSGRGLFDNCEFLILCRVAII